MVDMICIRVGAWVEFTVTCSNDQDHTYKSNRAFTFTWVLDDRFLITFDNLADKMSLLLYWVTYIFMFQHFLGQFYLLIPIPMSASSKNLKHFLIQNFKMTTKIEVTFIELRSIPITLYGHKDSKRYGLPGIKFLVTKLLSKIYKVHMTL